MPPRLNCSARNSVGRALQRTIASPTTRVAVFTAQDATRVASRQFATTGSLSSLQTLKLPDDYIPPTQPPSARRPELRQAQLIRTYTALLRSTPLMLFFQHNNLTAVEWAAVRRELRAALAAVPPPEAGPDGTVPIDAGSKVEFQVLRTRMFNVACRITEFFNAEEAKANSPGAYTHDLSEAAYDAIRKAKVDETSTYGQIAPLLVGPVATVTIPMVSPAHLEAVLKVLAPSPEFPAPARKKFPNYYDPIAQSGFQKLILVGGRVEGKAFDNALLKWVGGIEGGIDSLRARVVSLLHSAGFGLTQALEGHSKGLWLALEGRRTQLEDEANGGKKEGQEESAAASA